MISILLNREMTLCRPPLDPGSQSTHITVNPITGLGLPVKKQQVHIFFLGVQDELQH